MQLLRKILFPVSLIYALVVHIRNYLYDIGAFKSKTFQTPTIGIGNLSVGGTGKTPMAEFLISLLKDRYKIAFLSRGYRRKSTGFLMANTETTVEDLGDEPYQVYAKFPEISVAVDADRQNGISVLESKVSPDLILLDDAFQHRKVTCGLYILLTAYGNLYLKDWYLPTGNLRDSKREAKRADLIIVTKCPQNLGDTERNLMVRELNPKPHQRVLFSFLTYDSELRGDRKTFSLDYFRGKKVTLITGIADPDPLVFFLKEAGITFEHLRFKDHHFFTPKELRQLREKKYLLTTEKDYGRLKDTTDNLYYLSIEHRFLNDGQKILEDNLQRLMNLS